MEKTYIIVGDNNFWYSTFKASTQDEIDTEIEHAKETTDTGTAEPTEFYIYEVTEHQKIKL